MNEDRLRELYALGPARQVDDGACPDPEALRAIAERRASQEQRIETLRHVSRCPQCQRDLALLAQVAAAEPRPTRLAARWLPAAAAAVLVIGAIGVLRIRGPQDPVFRGGDALELVGPSGEVSSAMTATLVWRTVPRAARYEVEILDADGNVVFQGNVTDTVAPMPPSVAEAGTYRWRVTAVRADGARVQSALGAFTLGPG